MACILLPLDKSSLAFAEVGIPTIMDGLTNRIIDLHPSFADKVANVKDTNIDESILASITRHENYVYEQAKQWQKDVKPKMDNIQNQVFSYNANFQNTYNNIQKQIQVKNKNQILQLLDDLQSNIDYQKQDITEFLSILRDFKKNVAINSGQLQTGCTQIQATMDGYRTTLDALYDQLYATTSASVRKQLENQTYDISVKLYDKLEPLYNQINTTIFTLNGVNDGILNIGWLVSLEDIHTNWTTLESKLAYLIQNIKDTSDIDWAFITEDMYVIQTDWNEIYNKTTQL
ncbi:HBL/NHE enterotoxin family protein [Bacillus thuringiensis]|nr:HBL/NHE enterotoxin family protein [Bacillus thuringiensis]